MRYGLESILSEDCDVKLYEGTYLEPCVSGTSDILYSSHPYRSSPIYARSHLEFPELDTQYVESINRWATYGPYSLDW